jgi:hypothetical protein
MRRIVGAKTARTNGASTAETNILQNPLTAAASKLTPTAATWRKKPITTRIMVPDECKTLHTTPPHRRFCI